MCCYGVYMRKKTHGLLNYYKLVLVTMFNNEPGIPKRLCNLLYWNTVNSGSDLEVPQLTLDPLEEWLNFEVPGHQASEHLLHS